MVESVTCQESTNRGDTMKLSVHEDNSGALVLAKTLPPQFTVGGNARANPDARFVR
jgi:hypothetical protein